LLLEHFKEQNQDKLYGALHLHVNLSDWLQFLHFNGSLKSLTINAIFSITSLTLGNKA
jgi:hypothetical protein